MSTAERDGVYFGPLQDIAQIRGVTDIAIGHDGRVWVDAGVGMHEEFPRIPFNSAHMVKEYAIHLCAQLGSRLDDAHPIADASSAHGLRVHAVLEPLVPEGAAISIRLPPSQCLTLHDLEKRGFLSPRWTGVVRELVRRKASILISGGTGTGKTTLLRALLSECPEEERIVTVEEIREIGAAHEGNSVSLVARESNVEGAGGITLSQLVMATLRMRPDRIVLGECRGAEVADLLRAFNTGHTGGMVTLHCNGVERVPQRLVALGQLGGLDASSLLFLVHGAFDVVLHLRRVNGRRTLAQIGVLEDLPQGQDSEGVVGATGVSVGAGAIRGRAVASWRGHADVPTELCGWETFSRRWLS